MSQGHGTVASPVLAELATLFTEKAANDKEGSSTKARTSSLKPESILSTQRATHVGVSLARLTKGMDSEELLDALRSFDGQRALSLESLQSVSSCLPSDDEVKKLAAAAEKTDATLPKVESFLLELSHISHLSLRLDAWCFMKQAPARLAGLRVQADLMSRSCKEVLNSGKLKELLALVLSLGNALNASSSRKNVATGFKLETLLKLAELRSPLDGQVTLLRYLVGVVERDLPALLSFDKEIASVGDAALVATPSLASELCTASTELASLRQRIHQAEGDSESGSRMLLGALSASLGQIKLELDEAQNAYDLMQATFRTLSLSFGETRNLHPEQMMGTLAAFIKLFKDAMLDNAKSKMRTVRRQSCSSEDAMRKLQAEQNHNFLKEQVRCRRGTIA
jgi:hypothetical protein